MCTYEATRQRAYARQVTLRRVQVAQFDNLDQEAQRKAVDCIGHVWKPCPNKRGKWLSTKCANLGLVSGAGNVDAESGFVQLKPGDPVLVKLVRGILAKVEEIEDKLAAGETAVVACQHGSNRSVFVVNLFHQKCHNLDYETVRQLMCQHRGVKVPPPPEP